MNLFFEKFIEGLAQAKILSGRGDLNYLYFPERFLKFSSIFATLYQLSLKGNERIFPQILHFARII